MLDLFWRLLARVLAQPAIANWLIWRALQTPYSTIIKDGDIYMARFWLFNAYPDDGESDADPKLWRFPISIRINHILMPDYDRDKHDHPWNARTVILRGWYVEERDNGTFCRLQGTTARLRYGEYHRITQVPHNGVWTLFITGRKRGPWGFDVDGVKVLWKKYLGIE